MLDSYSEHLDQLDRWRKKRVWFVVMDTVFLPRGAIFCAELGTLFLRS